MSSSSSDRSEGEEKKEVSYYNCSAYDDDEINEYLLHQVEFGTQTAINWMEKLLETDHAINILKNEGIWSKREMDKLVARYHMCLTVVEWYMRNM